MTEVGGEVPLACLHVVTRPVNALLCKVVALHVVFHSDGKAVCKASTFQTMVQTAV